MLAYFMSNGSLIPPLQVTEGSVIVTVYFIQSSQGANLTVLVGQMEQDVSVFL